MLMTTRTFRIFISSTFEDLIEERNALQLKVFPRLRKLCEVHGARFQPVDLRWGVPDEAVLGQRLMEICFTEIERCHRARTNPSFIILVGNRYGRPVLPGRIPAVEFEGILMHLQDPENRTLVESWYQLDDNAVPPEYLLKPRSGELMNRERWEKVEDLLQKALLEAARALELENPILLKYHGSATHQEIVKGLGPNPSDRRHVFAFFRKEQKGSAVGRVEGIPPPAVGWRHRHL